MRLILLFFKRQKDFFIFLILFVISFAFIINANSYQSSKFLHSANIFSANIYSVTNSVGTYFNLKHQNDLLVEENANLRQKLIDLQTEKINNLSGDTEVTFSPNKYKVYRAEVIKNSYNLSKNYILINKGIKDSIAEDMGVISPLGIVGIVDKTTNRFASVQSVLNTLSKISVTLKKSGYYGTLYWDGKEPNIVQFTDLPNITPVAVGDTIVTAGHSNIFPKDIPVGSVKDFYINPHDNSLLINVKLFTDMLNLQYVYIIQNKDQEPIRELENQVNLQANE
ncbi:MAG: rod shape-determining protein MreC [Capnocytophaga sp.]|nr:rod shape-determining protein MreC [Capnocytophaga sp.]